MTTPIAARGTVLRMGDGAGPPENFTAIARVIGINGSPLSLDTEDATDHDSPGGYEEVVATILRTGEVTFDVHFLPDSATHGTATGLIKKQVDRTLTSFELIFPNTAATKWEFSAFVTGFEPAAPHDGKLVASVTLKPSGQPTLA